MRLSESEVFAEYAKTPQDDRCYDFYRCYKCLRVFSRQEELESIVRIDQGENFCECGSTRFTPSWPVGVEWLKPNVAKYAIKLFLARGVAPKLDKYSYTRFALPWIEKLVKLT